MHQTLWQKVMATPGINFERNLFRRPNAPPACASSGGLRRLWIAQTLHGARQLARFCG